MATQAPPGETEHEETGAPLAQPRTDNRPEVRQVKIGVAIAVLLLVGFVGTWYGHNNGYSSGYNAGVNRGRHIELRDLPLDCSGIQQRVTTKSMSWDEVLHVMYPGYSAPGVNPRYLEEVSKQAQSSSLQYLSQAGSLNPDGSVGTVPAGTKLAGPTECMAPRGF